MTDTTNSENEPTSAIVSHERALWLSVIQQAIEDAMMTVTESSDLARKLDQKRALAWLLEPNRDFAAVCLLAGVEPEWTRNRARKIIAKEAPKPVRMRRGGVPANFQTAVGTGPGSSAQDRNEMEFS
jgi:hypothetical protein